MHTVAEGSKEIASSQAEVAEGSLSLEQWLSAWDGDDNVQLTRTNILPCRKSCVTQWTSSCSLSLVHGNEVAFRTTALHSLQPRQLLSSS